MAAKKPTKSRTSAASKKKGFVFKWWMALVIVVLVAGVGIAVLRFSQASRRPDSDPAVAQAKSTMLEYSQRCAGTAEQITAAIRTGERNCTTWIQAFLAYSALKSGKLPPTVNGNLGPQTQEYILIVKQGVNNYINNYNYSEHSASENAEFDNFLTKTNGLLLNGSEVTNGFVFIASLITFLAAGSSN